MKEAAGAASEGRKVGGAVVLVLRDKSPLIECVVSANGATSVMYTADKRLHFFSVADHLSGDKKKIGESDSTFLYPISGLHISPDGARLLGMIDASTLAIVTKKPKILHHLRGNVGLASMALHPEGEQLVAGLGGGVVRIWNTKTGEPEKYLQCHDKDINNIEFLPDGKFFVTSAADRTIRFFTFPGGMKIREIPVSQPPRQMFVSKDGAAMVTLIGKVVQVWDLKLFAEKRRFEPAKPSMRIALSESGRSIAVAHAGGSVSVYDADTGARLLGWDAHPGHEIVCLRWVRTAGRSLIVTAAAGDDVVFWDLARLRGSKKGKAKRRRRGR